MVKIMIIDDQPLLVKWLSEKLLGSEYHISWTDNTDDITRYVKTFTPDIILLDIHIGGFERWDILHRIKLEYPHLPVLIVSTYGSVTRDRRGDKTAGYITKSICMDTLKNKIEEMLDFSNPVQDITAR